MSRSKNTMKNSIFGVGSQLLNSVISFICRTVFIKVLGSTYLGIGGLFTNILSVLSLAELGIGSAMTYNLYKPLAKKDSYAVAKYMNLYAKAYKIIGISITTIGLFLTPFLKYIIKDINAIPNIHLIYIMYIVNAGSSYFFSYIRTLYEADQRNYVVMTIQTFMNFLMNVIQIIVLVTIKNYIAYFSISIIFSILSNIAISLKGLREYEFLKEHKEAKLDDEEKKTLVKHIAAMMSHKVGSIVVSGTDNIIISTVLGLETVGIYSNYTTIINMVKSFINPVLSAFTASVGNLNSTESVDKSYSVFKAMYLFEYWLHGTIAICFFVLFPPFIRWWIGDRYLISTTVLLVLVANYYFTNMRHAVTTYNTTLGLFWNDRFKPWVEAAVNLISSLILVQKIGLSGVFVGTLISTIVVCWWVEPYLLYKHYFKRNVFNYYFKFVIDLLLLGVWGYLINLLTIRVENLILKFIVCGVLTVPYFIIRFSRTEEFHYIMAFVKPFLLKMYRRK